MLRSCTLLSICHVLMARDETAAAVASPLAGVILLIRTIECDLAAASRASRIREQAKTGHGELNVWKVHSVSPTRRILGLPRPTRQNTLSPDKRQVVLQISLFNPKLIPSIYVALFGDQLGRIFLCQTLPAPGKKSNTISTCTRVAASAPTCRFHPRLLDSANAFQPQIDIGSPAMKALHTYTATKVFSISAA